MNQNKKVLITGGCGFVGSNIALSLKSKYPSYQVVCFDNLRRRGAELSINKLKQAKIEFVHGDIRQKADLAEFEDIDVIIDACAEPSVLSGLNGQTDYLVQTNLNGTINCLDLAVKKKADFIFLSTSRIYPIDSLCSMAYTEGDTRLEIAENQLINGISKNGISEDFPGFGHRSLYGATKLASELFISEYQKSFGLRTVVNRCGVLTGPYQMGKVDQGVVVLWAARHFWKKKLNYIGFGGTGKQVRDILHVKDLFRLVDYQMNNLDAVNGETFNVGGGIEVSVSLQELTGLCERISGNKIEITKISETRQADIPIYITDNSKVTQMTGWKPEIFPEEIMKDIFAWIEENQDSLEPILS